MESAKKKYIKPEITFHQYRLEDSMDVPEEWYDESIIDDEVLMCEGFHHFVVGRCTRSSTVERGWY